MPTAKLIKFRTIGDRHANNYAFPALLTKKSSGTDAPAASDREARARSPHTVWGRQGKAVACSRREHQMKKLGID